MSILAKVRGIYATALTRLLLDKGYGIVQPSPGAREQFGLPSADGDWELSIKDREDLQGVQVCGAAEKIAEFITAIRRELEDAVLTYAMPEEEFDGVTCCARIEFPGESKEALDRIRSSIIPTVACHHRFRVIASKDLGKAEEILSRQPQRRQELEKSLFEAAVLIPMLRETSLAIEHTKVSGKPIRPRMGMLCDYDQNRIVIKRCFRSPGRYDGLDLPIERGDYCLTEATEGQWYIRHAYYSGTHGLKGEYYNVNTPVEFYPHGIRYVDLEIDVVRRTGEPPFVVDREKLALVAREGVIGAALEKKALGVAEGLKLKLQEQVSAA